MTGLPAADQLQAVLEAFLATTPGTPAAAVAVIDGDGRLVEVAAGIADPSTAEPMTVRHGLRIASSTKPFVAASILRLVEQGRLALEDPVISRVSPAVERLLAGRRDGDRISVRQLLQHTSGLPDHTTPPSFVAGLLAEPTRVQPWSEQLEAGLAMDAVGAPGERFSYSDTGYVLLGRVLEHVSGEALHRVVRTLVGYEAHGLASTWWEAFEAPPSPDARRAHQLLGGIDTHDWSPTFDSHGGGGLVAPMADLARFWRALFAGRVHGLLDEQTGALVPTASAEHPAPGDRIGLGVFRLTIDGLPAWGHGGFWGTRELHLPTLATSLALGVTNRDPTVDLRAALLEPVVASVADAAGS